MINSEFTKRYIKELIARRRDLSKGSLANCHAKGLYSIILQENPIIRLFVTGRDHELYSCYQGVPNSIAFHPHHCDLKFDIVCGQLANYLFSPKGLILIENLLQYNKYYFDSKINGGKGKFTYMKESWTESYYWNILNPGDVEIMEANEIHTVYVEPRSVTAWLVTEGKEDPDYEPVAYAVNQDLSTLNMDNLYKPISHNVAMNVVDMALTAQ